MNKRDSQLLTANLLGSLAFGSAITFPAGDRLFLSMLKGRRVGETPEGEASTMQLLDAWRKGYMAEDLRLKTPAASVRR